MIPLACPIKAKARHWSAEGNEVLFLFQKMFKQQIIFSALSLVSTTGNHRVTVPATCVFLDLLSLCCKNLPRETFCGPQQSSSILCNKIPSFLPMFLFSSPCQCTDCSALTPQVNLCIAKCVSRAQMVTDDDLREKAGILQTFMEKHLGTPNQRKKITSTLKLLFSSKILL